MIDTGLQTSYPTLGAYDCDHTNYDNDKPRIKSILWKHYYTVEEWDSLGKARPCVLDNIQKTLLCKTDYLGADFFECPECGNFNVITHHCHSRFCTSCGAKQQKILAWKAQYMCLDVPHRHVVFTIPENYRVFFRRDREALNLLFVAARNTICKVVNESYYKKYKRNLQNHCKVRNDKDNYYLFRNVKGIDDFGMIATIHTFGRALNWNPHVHCLVPELSYNPKKDKVKHINYFNFTNLRLTWQYEINRLMLERFGKKFRKVVNTAYNDYESGFYVYAKSNQETVKEDNPDNKVNSKNVAGCVNYMMRYASRPAMAESRLISYDEDSDDVVWFYDDHKTEDRITVKEKGIDLLKKMIIHIPDTGFRMVRYYGFYNQKKQNELYHIHELLGNPKRIAKYKVDRKIQQKQKLSKFHYRTMIMDTYNRDVLMCKCGNIMEYTYTWNPLEGIHNDRYYRRSCIDEMYEMRVRGKRAIKRFRSS